MTGPSRMGKNSFRLMPVSDEFTSPVTGELKKVHTRGSRRELEIMTDQYMVRHRDGRQSMVHVPRKPDVAGIAGETVRHELLTGDRADLVARLVLGVDTAVALLLGAVLAPTDPVLAAAVSVNNAADHDRLRYGLSGEAGLNDGMAFPFVIFALLWSQHGGAGGWIGAWVLHRVVWAIPAGLLLGYALGTGVGRLAIGLRSSAARGISCRWLSRTRSSESTSRTSTDSKNPVGESVCTGTPADRRVWAKVWPLKRIDRSRTTISPYRRGRSSSVPSADFTAI